jgi:hypothetical protein
MDRYSCEYNSMDEYISKIGRGNGKESGLHTNLVPVPYSGNLKNSTVFILTLNSGLKPLDYFAECNVLTFKAALIRNLKQENADEEFPNLSFCPTYTWHGGFDYWTRRLNELIYLLVYRRGVSYLDSLRGLSRQVSILELVPWHSERVRQKGSWMNLMR